MSTNMSAAHTPGPRFAGDPLHILADTPDGYWQVYVYADGGNRTVALAYGNSRAEAEANASLIAAAPETAQDRDDLFLALEDAAEQLEKSGLRYLVVREIVPLLERVKARLGKERVRELRRAAIAKAEGRS